MSEDLESDRLDEVLRALADRVRLLRGGRGMSLSDLAFESALSESRLRAVESGRAAPSLATLVAIADTFEIGLADLFEDATKTASNGADAEPLSPYVVPSPVVWGGEIPPAPWVTASGDTAREVEVPDERHPVRGASDVPPFQPAEKVWGGPLPQAPWVPQEPLGTDEVVVPSARMTSTPAATHAHDYALANGMRKKSAYVFVAPGASAKPAPRTFADLRTGALAGRDFRSLQEFAVASVVEGGYALADVARVFRIPPWRLDQWVRETGHTPH
ncbi:MULTISPECIES: helix-turn-helix domain-containing protein [Microbacterium]|uniref:helix-turn-helix domain-containing protein n=1 Tax=Microbacterium TaxID=33882 RepID=UPI0027878D60|nr:MULTISPECIES: helix-turn-helix transcriptional regulator [Microbacterium]MDQ1074317.1 DNA-binding XRE family transcriptional regulator [Microbacterium sp. SORGH_AS_0969]MDQ1114546.1 DNA-binding XRE family transcriptional regulator [Microbacterium testaceum]